MLHPLSTIYGPPITYNIQRTNHSKQFTLLLSSYKIPPCGESSGNLPKCDKPPDRSDPFFFFFFLLPTGSVWMYPGSFEPFLTGAEAGWSMDQRKSKAIRGLMMVCELSVSTSCAVSCLILMIYSTNFGQVKLYFRSSSVWFWLWFTVLLVRGWVPGVYPVSFLPFLLFHWLADAWLLGDIGWHLYACLAELTGGTSSRVHTYVCGL